MTDAIHEQLSAFADGELSAAESELLLKRVERDAELRERLGRYGLAGEALRATRAQGPSRHFVANVSAAIDRENAPVIKRDQVMQWLKPVAGGAIAAGVAAVVLVAMQVRPHADGVPSMANQPMNNIQSSQSSSQSVSNVTIGVTRSAAVSRNGKAPTSYVVPMPASSNQAGPPIQVINHGRLANYVVAHSEYSSTLGPRNVLTGLLAEESQSEFSAPNTNSMDGSSFNAETHGIPHPVAIAPGLR